MNQIPEINPIFLRCIITIYLFLFFAALGVSGYFLYYSVQTKPIPLIDLAKYSLLCFLFMILLINTITAASMKPGHLQRLAISVKNFKWLFTIVLIISLMAKFGLIKTNQGKSIEICESHLAAVGAAMLFCYWSDTFLKKYEEPPSDET